MLLILLMIIKNASNSECDILCLISLYQHFLNQTAVTKAALLVSLDVSLMTPYLYI